MRWLRNGGTAIPEGPPEDESEATEVKENLQDIDDDEPVVLCFRCGKPAVGLTSVLTGTKDGVPIEERDVAVCEDCYSVLKEKARTRSKLDD